MHSRMSKPTKGKLKRCSFSYYSRILERQQPDMLEYMPRPIPIHAAIPCWERQKFPTIRTCIPSIEIKVAQTDPAGRPITLEHNSVSYPQEEWTEVYTEGSAIVATRDEGGPDQHNKSVSYEDEKTILKSLIARKRHRKYPDFNPTDSYLCLDREDQVILITQRAGWMLVCSVSSRLVRQITVLVA